MTALVVGYRVMEACTKVCLAQVIHDKVGEFIATGGQSSGACQVFRIVLEYNFVVVDDSIHTRARKRHK